MKAGYTQCEYIESNGTQYINTYYSPNQNTKVWIDIEVTNYTESDFFGALDSDTLKGFALRLIDGHQVGHYYNSSSQGPAFDLEFDFPGRNLFVVDKNKAYINESLLTLHATATFSCGYPLFLLWANIDNKSSLLYTTPPMSAKLYGCKIYDSDQLIIDLVPCIDSNGTYGLYDNKSDYFYTSSGSMPFSGPYVEGGSGSTSGFNYLNISPAEFRHRLLSANSSKLPPGYYECEYIESNGKLFINTGYKFTSNNIKIETEIVNLNESSFYALFGSENKNPGGVNGGSSIIAYCNSTMSPDTCTVESAGTSNSSSITLPIGLKLKLSIELSGGVLYIKNNELSLTYASSGYTEKLCSFFLFACNINGMPELFSKNRIYSCTLYDNGVKVRDYIPCVNPEGYFGLYDTVSKTFFKMKEEITILQTQTVKGYSIDLQNQWRESTTYTVSSPKDGLYESYSNYNVNSDSATCIITVEPGVTDLYIHPAVSSESSYDYLNIYTFYLNGTLHINFWSKSGNDTIASDITLLGYKVSNNVNSTMLSLGYQIRCTYSKDSSLSSYNDRGYFYLTGGYVTKQVETETIVDTIGAGKVIIPENYTWVDCIHGSGGAFILTNYKPNNNTKIVMDAKCYQMVDATFLFGCYDSSPYYFYVGDGLYNISMPVGRYEASYDPELNINLEIGQGKYIVNGYSQSYSNSSFTKTHPLAIFASNNNGSINTSYGSMNLHHFVISENSKPLYLFVPCTNSSGVYGLYDVVGKQFYSSASSVPFDPEFLDISYDFPYNGTKATVTLPKGNYKLECWGAQGGSYNTTYAVGGSGGYSKGIITLSESTNLYIYPGGQGVAYATSTYTSQGGGGFNGGGGAGYRGGGGGGASDIRIGTDSLYARVIVAGGGGGAYSYSSSYKANGGVGGGAIGTDGSYYSSSYSSWVGKAGTQTAGGAQTTGSNSSYYGGAGTFGVGGSTGYKYNSTSYYSNGAGGGGWYGGSAAGNYSSSSRTRACGGGGGSGYVYTSSTASSYPSGVLLNSSYYLQQAITEAGTNNFKSPTGVIETGHVGDGYVRITASLRSEQYLERNNAGAISIDWSIKAGSWDSTSYSPSMDGLKWTCLSPGHSGMTVIRCTFSGISSITFNCVYSGESNYDYLTISNLDTGATRESYGTTLKGNSGTARDVTFTCDPGVSHYVEFCYSKDGSDTSGSDNATVYIKSYS